jgi:hypothetical protein
MTQNDEDNAELDLSARISKIDQLESEIVRKGALLLPSGSTFTHADMFVLGALRRTLAQARGFRDLIGSKNFPCAAGILRMQIDTAMRVYGLTLVADWHVACAKLFDGERYNKLKDRDGKRLTDAHLREKLAEIEPWVTSVYEGTSDFIHLSSRHLYNSIERLDEAEQLVYFNISGHDPTRPDDAYFEIVDAFFQATRIAGISILGFLNASAASRAGPA